MYTRNYLFIFCSALGLLWSSTSKSIAQKDSISYILSYGFLSSTENHLPLYAHSLRGGVYDYDFNGVYTMATVQHTKFIGKDMKFTNGLSAFFATQENTFFIQEAYSEIGYKWLNFLAGWKSRQDAPSVYPTLGRYGISNNARPIPVVGFHVPEFTELPFVNGFFEFKGSLFHGWFEENRYINSPLLHEKSIYLSLGGNTNWRLWGGINHFAMYGGRNPLNPEVSLYDGFGDYLSVFIASGRENEIGGEQNAIGNHLGYWIFTFSYEFEDFYVELYNENLFDDGKGLMFWDLDESKDRTVGLNFDFTKKEDFFLNKLSLLFMTTKFQQGPGLPDDIGIDNFGFPFGGRDDFYNNFLYRDGWTHRGRIIGNPLFIERNLSKIYFGIIPDYDVAIINNRFRAYHLGAEFEYKNWDFKFLGTYTRNFGTYAGLYEGRFRWNGIQTNPDFEYTFLPHLNQAYFLLESTSNPFKNKKVQLGLSLTVDRGQITNNFGFGASVAYSDFIIK